MPSAPVPPSFDALVPRVRRETGLSIPSSRKAAVVSAFRRIMQKRGTGDWRCLADRIGRDEELTDELVAEITVGESYFFRDPAQFDILRKLLRRRSSPLMRIWSAGCSTGEEPYSLAILLEEEDLADRASIIATDISRDALAKARKAEFGEWSLRDGGANRLERYFWRRGERFHLKRRLVRRVTFQHLCLGTDTLPSPEKGIGGFDLILCRNVLIYLEREVVARIARQLFDCLADGGWLLIGPSDPPLWEHAPFNTVITTAGVVYGRGISQETAISRQLREEGPQ